MTTQTEFSKSAATKVVVSGSDIDIQGAVNPSRDEIVEMLEGARLSITAMLNQMKGVGIVGSDIEIKKDV